MTTGDGRKGPFDFAALARDHPPKAGIPVVPPQDEIVGTHAAEAKEILVVPKDQVSETVGAGRCPETVDNGDVHSGKREQVSRTAGAREGGFDDIQIGGIGGDRRGIARDRSQIRRDARRVRGDTRRIRGDLGAVGHEGEAEAVEVPKGQ